MLILIDIAETRKKRFSDLFSSIYIEKKFFQTYFLEKLDMLTKNFNFRVHIGSKTTKLGIFTHEFFEEFLEAKLSAKKLIFSTF